MFNYDAEQIFVVQPRSAGGGILAFLLSLDSGTASLDFRSQALEDKLNTWDRFLLQDPGDAHCYGFCNFGQKLHAENIMTADHCDRYVHKHHFYELDYLSESKKHPLLDAVNGAKNAVGIYVTEECVRSIQTLRPATPDIDFYQKWVYSNQHKLLPDFFGIQCLHTLPFCDLLHIDKFLDHLSYCKEIFGMDTDTDLFRPRILQWYAMIGHSPTAP